MYRPNGKTTYTDHPCEAGERRSGVSVTDNAIDASSLRREVARSRAGAVQPTESNWRDDVDGAPAVVDPSSTSACRTARREYEVEASIKTKPNLLEMERKRLVAQRACGYAERRNADHTMEQLKTDVKAQRRADSAEAMRRGPPPERATITRCAGAFCYDNLGNIYMRQPMPDGQTVLRSSNRTICPFVNGLAYCH